MAQPEQEEAPAQEPEGQAARVARRTAGDTPSLLLSPVMHVHRIKQSMSKFALAFRRGKSGHTERVSKLLVGEVLKKVGRKGKVKAYRFFVPESRSCLLWESTSMDAMLLPKNKVKLVTVVELRLGQRTPVFERALDKETDHLSFSLIYVNHGVSRSLDLVCDDLEQFERWTSGLAQFILEETRLANTSNPDQDFILQKWHELELNANRLQRKDLNRLFNALNVVVSRKFVLKQFKLYDNDNNGEIDFEEFCQMLDSLRVRDDLRQIFTHFHDIDGAPDDPDAVFMSASAFHDFLTRHQRESITLEETRQLIKAFSVTCEAKGAAREAQLAAANPDVLSMEGFVRYMRHNPDSIVRHEQKGVCDDMSLPLTDYFISSSHNTYLMQDQVFGLSSVEMYIRGFRTGIRSVELDLWDGHDGQPIIKHGGTATSNILAQEVIKVVRDFAFVDEDDPFRHQQVFRAHTYHYNMPVILSLENHLCIEQQRVLANMFVSILGERLALPEKDEGDRMKSPLQLKGKVLLKGKKLSEASEGQLPHSESMEDDLFEDPEEEVEVEPGSKKAKQAKVHTKVCKELSDITYLTATKIKSWDDSWANAKPSCMSSFGNQKLQKFHRDVPKVVRYNTKNFSRIYPSVGRDALLKSANYDPVPFWCLGCQLVSLNIQTPDRALRINSMVFQNRNGNSGYMLKPKILREPNPVSGRFFKYDQHPLNDSRVLPCLLTITVLSAHQLPKPNNEVIDPYVHLEMLGVPQDRKTFRTRTVRHNGFNPSWNERFTFHVTVPDLAILYLEVRDEDISTESAPVGYYAIPVCSMMEGYRSMQLRNAAGQVTDYCSLFVRVALTQHKRL